MLKLFFFYFLISLENNLYTVESWLQFSKLFRFFVFVDIKQLILFQLFRHYFLFILKSCVFFFLIFWYFFEFCRINIDLCQLFFTAEALSCYKNTEKGNVAEDCGAQTGCIKKFYQKSKFIRQKKGRQHKSW